MTEMLNNKSTLRTETHLHACTTTTFMQRLVVRDNETLVSLRDTRSSKDRAFANELFVGGALQGAQNIARSQITTR